MASSPSRLTEVTATRGANDAVDVTWKPAVEQGISSYRVRWEDGEGATGGARVVRGTSARLTGVPKGARVAVRAIGAGGLEGWDWARVAVSD